MTKARLRHLAVPIGLAVLAAVLVGTYIVTYRNSVNSGAGLVKVLVATRDIPAGTTGSTVASGGYLKGETVPRRAVVPGSVVSGAPLTSLVATAPIQKGEQVTLRQFGPIARPASLPSSQASSGPSPSAAIRPSFSPAPSRTAIASTSSPMSTTRPAASAARRRV